MPGKLPHIIFLVMDTCGAKHMSLCGYGRPTTPQLERIAENATVYERCFSPSCWTIPAHASMFTGLYPSQHGAHEKSFYLNGDCLHLVDALKRGGYRTYGISCNGLVGPVTGIAQHFEVFLDYGWCDALHLNLLHDASQFPSFMQSPGERPLSREIAFFWEHLLHNESWLSAVKILGSKVLKALFPGPVNRSPRYTRRSLRKAVKVLAEHTRKEPGPLFLFINLLETHAMYAPPQHNRRFARPSARQEFLTTEFYKGAPADEASKTLPMLLDLYDDEVRFLDALVGEFWHSLEALNLLNDCVVIITSDHGEHFGEKGYYEHNLSLYNELIWVPLLVKFPQALLDKGSVHRPVSLNDIFSTCLDVAENPLPRPYTSKSLLDGSGPNLVASEIVDDTWWQTRFFGSTGGSRPGSCGSALILENGWKLVWKKPATVEIYDLNQDPCETLDLYSPQNFQAVQDFLKQAPISLGFDLGAELKDPNLQ